MSELKEILPNLKEGEPLAPHTNFKIGGPAKYFAEISDLDILSKTLQWLSQNHWPYFVLGGGTNILVNDQGFDGLVIKLVNNQIKILEHNQVLVEAGAKPADLITTTLAAGLTGLEFAAGIPGSVGGGIYGNAGTFGVAFDSVVEKVIALTPSGEIKEVSKADCGFQYRHSQFKINHWLIFSAQLQLAKGDVEESKKIIKERIDKRLISQPYNVPSAGCAFKNIVIDQNIMEALAKHHKEIPEQFIKNGKIPTAWLIEQLDLKGKAMGSAQISDKHANYIINTGQAKAADVVMLMSFIKQQVRDKLSIQLEEEVQLVGF
ncbi:MAG: UDP-N-acetylmuramate dehydrogenase [Candidatus Komeilibacteria bacterium]|nr:UDP-N-acetylmuramate dehydrogenase [Candidatus Komeilibacteria bacterium]